MKRVIKPTLTLCDDGRQWLERQKEAGIPLAKSIVKAIGEKARRSKTK